MQPDFEPSSETIYRDLRFPEAPDERPYTLINMVTTVDGKSISGERDESVVDLGSKFDHQLMRRIESAVDATLMGASTLRATSPTWSPRTRLKVVVTASGQLPADTAYLSGAGLVAAPAGTEIAGAEVWHVGERTVDLKALLFRLRREADVRRLLVLGGSELNGQLLAADLVDELFLTIAPKVKLGREVPTYAGGEPLSRERIQSYRLLEHHVVGDELFLRYARRRQA